MTAGAPARRSMWLLAPVAVATLVLVVVPTAMTIAMAFTDYDALTPARWAGLGNFRRLLADPLFRTALWNSLIFVAMAVPIRLAAATGMAILLARPRRGVASMRALTYLPTVVPDISYALLWLWMFNPLYGPIGLGLQAIGFEGSAILLSDWGARSAIAIMTAFQIGEGFIVALAARRDIPSELYELAEIDGVPPLWTLRKVTLPMMGPVLVLLAARDIVLSFQTNFVPALALTRGGPEYATTFLPLYTYQNAFEFLRFGYASAMTLAMYAVSGLVVAAQLLAVRRWRSAFDL